LARDEHDQPTARGTCFDQLNAAHPMEMMIGLLGGGFAPVAIVLSFLAEEIETRPRQPTPQCWKFFRILQHNRKESVHSTRIGCRSAR
jgi:hypothetical protein